MFDSEIGSTGKDSYPQLKELAERLFFHGPGARRDKGEPLIFVGELPNQLPVNVPMPEQSRILGTVFHRPDIAEIVVDVAMRPEKVISAYVGQLLSAGWTYPPTYRRPGGFTEERSEVTGDFCFGPGGPMLSIIAHPMGEMTSDLRLYLSMTAQAEADTDPEVEEYFPPPARWVIPSLPAPSGAWKSGPGGSVDDDRQLSSCTLETKMQLGEVLEHYARHLVRAGWKRLDTARTDLALCCNWSFSDDNDRTWSGLLIVTKTDAQSKICFASILADRL